MGSKNKTVIGNVFSACEILKQGNSPNKNYELIDIIQLSGSAQYYPDGKLLWSCRPLSSSPLLTG